MNAEFNNILDKLGIKYCFNEQNYDFSKLKFIIVGDNPGDTEYQKKRFFIGASGKKLRKHFLINGLIENFDDECFIRNKTFISTTKTDQLKEIKTKIGIDYFDEILVYCANEIAEISNEFDLPILIFGKSKIGPSLLFDKFWKVLNKAVIKKENILVFNHPSYNHFFNEWDKYKQEFEMDSSIKLLHCIGRINTINLNNKYKK